MTYLYVALGGALGAVLRYLTVSLVAAPLGTLIVNVLGSFLMGLAFVFVAQKGMDRAAPLLMTGVLGGFTTFSAYSLDAWKLLTGGREIEAAFYIFGSVVLSLIAVGLGILVARAVA